MSEHFARRRYLLNFETQRLGQVFTDVLVIGSGVAGLRAAVEAAASASVILVTKDTVPQCNTAYAQGGIAVVTDAGDSVEAHVADTITVGCGLCDEPRVRIMTSEGSDRLRELVQWGASFDLEGGRVALGLEGGHSARRIVHASGDATGKELSRTLARQAGKCERLRLFENCFVIDLVVEDGRCLAAITHHPKYGHQIIWAGQIVLASGGAGCLFRETTNAPSATADGHAIAFRAGAVLRDMEFVQFHPTALYVAGAARALISEAVRGEGALLVDRDGTRFMTEYHADAELAPRDVVARAILRQMGKTKSTCVYLDVRHMAAGRFEARFPTIAALCRDFDIDVRKKLIPVRPAAHYMIGGLSVDIDGRTSIDGLLACGEASSSGVHGANRLASNSLLEGLVFGARVGRLAAESGKGQASRAAHRNLANAIDPSARSELDLADVRNSLRALMWRNGGIDRTGDRLSETLEIIDFWARYVMDKVLEDRLGWETQNMLTVARCIAQSALARQESRGVHFRSDFPESDAACAGHITIARRSEAIGRGFEPLAKSPAGLQTA
jgi:L-aspartate oxidase